jgi:DNA-binding winged helix-turn-helix (wHTH) protein
MPQTTFKFGPFTIDAAARLLFRDGNPIPLTPKAADLLIALLKGQGEVVTKEQLLTEVWPNTFVTTNSLVGEIFKLRKTLKDDWEGGPLIETVPNRGYRFTAAVTSE